VTLYDELMIGTIDLHCHIDLEFSREHRKREPEMVWLPKADAIGMRGVVLKSHWWPTANAVPYMTDFAQTKVALWSSVTLNPSVGGPNPCVIEACAAMGGKMIFLPTWSARNDVLRKGFSARMGTYYRDFSPGDNPGFVFTNEAGELLPIAYSLIESCKARRLTLGSGHVSWEESIALAKAARDMGFSGFVINHPLSAMIAAPLGALQQAAEMGAFIEVCWTQLAPGRMEPAALVEKIRAVGLEQVVASTDYFRPYSPNPPELLRSFLGMLHEGGLSKDEIRRIACINPARALGLE
jgi:Family of unknown function (DUF6282)